MIKFRDLTANEIDCRVSTINEKGLTLLLYKDARCDMNILDETVGAENWERDHKELKGNIYCGIGIWSETKNRYVCKWDCGSESYTEKEKGEASDSFKRAGFNWGIGRELYTAPFIWVPAGSYSAKERNGKLTTYDKFKVSKITIVDKKITELTIINQTRGEVIYQLGGFKTADKKPIFLKTVKQLIEETGTAEVDMLDYFNAKSLDELTEQQLIEANKILSKKKEKQNADTDKQN